MTTPEIPPLPPPNVQAVYRRAAAALPRGTLLFVWHPSGWYALDQCALTAAKALGVPGLPATLPEPPNTFYMVIGLGRFAAACERLSDLGYQVYYDDAHLAQPVSDEAPWDTRHLSRN